MACGLLEANLCVEELGLPALASPSTSGAEGEVGRDGKAQGLVLGVHHVNVGGNAAVTPLARLRYSDSTFARSAVPACPLSFTGR